MKLSNSSVVRYSSGEKEVSALLSRKRQTTLELVKRKYGDNVPANALAILRVQLTSLARKMKENGDKRKIMKSRRRGPHPVEYWIE